MELLHAIFAFNLVTSLGMAPEQTGYFSGGVTLGAALMGIIDPKSTRLIF